MERITKYIVVAQCACAMTVWKLGRYEKPGGWEPLLGAQGCGMMNYLSRTE